MKLAAMILGVLLLALGASWYVAACRWRRTTDDFVARLTVPALRAAPTTFHLKDLEGLPAPVARYLRTVLPEGRPLIRVARLSQHGTFLFRPTLDGWRPFVSSECFTSAPPGFVWDARIRVMPGADALVRDAFLDGEGYMRASIAGLVTVLDVHQTPEIAAGALHRYLAEAVWLPTALLPSQGAVWSAVDDSTARATLTRGGTTVSLDFRFGADGLVSSVYTPARFRDVGGRGVPTPWRGRFRRYERRDGVTIPLEGEVEWVLPEGPQPYWRGTIDGVTFQ